MGMVGWVFGPANPAHVMSCFKRAITFVRGKNALCVRLPSESNQAPAHRVTCDNVHKDCIIEDHKTTYGIYLSTDVTREYDGYQEALRREADMIDAWIQAGEGKTKDQLRVSWLSRVQLWRLRWPRHAREHGSGSRDRSQGRAHV